MSWRTDSITCHNPNKTSTFKGNVQIDQNLSFGDASTDTLTVTGTATFSTDVNMNFGSGENLAITHSAMGESDKPIALDITPASATKGSRQGAIYIGMERTTQMTNSDGNPDCALKIGLKNATDSTDYCRLRGIDLSVETDESGDGTFSLEGASFTVKDVSGTTISDSGHMYAIKALTNKQGSGDADVIGILVQDDSQSATGTHMGLKVTSANYDVARANAIYIDSANGSWANGISFDGTITNTFDFAETDGTNGLTIGTHDSSDANPTGHIKIDGNGTTYYLYVYANAVTFS